VVAEAAEAVVNHPVGAAKVVVQILV